MLVVDLRLVVDAPRVSPVEHIDELPPERMVAFAAAAIAAL